MDQNRPRPKPHTTTCRLAKQLVHTRRFTHVTVTISYDSTVTCAVVPVDAPTQQPHDNTHTTSNNNEVACAPLEFAALLDPHPPDHTTTTTTYK